MDSAKAGPVAGILDALHFAADAHRDRRRKDRVTPYINHPIEMVRLLWVEAGIHDVELVVAAALHGYLADCCGGPGEPTVEEGRKHLRQRFGERVLACVDAVSGDRTLPKDERKRLQVEHAADLPRDARLVKLADTIANLRDLVASPPVGWPLERRIEYFDWTRSVIDRIRGTDAVLEALFDEAYALRPGWR